MIQYLKCESWMEKPLVRNEPFFAFYNCDLHKPFHNHYKSTEVRGL